jgi:rfaE bifunctional protein nucleotidyltransferase chain/domain
MTQNGKIKSLETLADRLAVERSQNKKVVLCHGVFDLLHVGHIRYLEQARQMGDVLCVTVTPDCYVDKGPHRPAFTELLRAEVLASLDCVDHVAINQWPTAEETLRLLKPSVYVKGSEFKDLHSDMTGKISKEAEVVREVGGQLAFTEDIIFSSTNLINRYLSSQPEEIRKYLELFRQRHSFDEVLQVLERMGSMKVLVVGDAILDEYQYCEAIGKSSKDPILALKYQSHDLFVGGVISVANHVANFADEVQLATVLGERNSHEDFIRSQLHPKTSTYFGIQPNAPTLIKRRFIEGYSLTKLFEVYVMDDKGLPADRDGELRDWLKREIPKYDMVIASDFGHGAISDDTVRLLCEEAKFLAVNTQANAGNRGFHTLSRYPRIDYACIQEHEIRLEMRDLVSDVQPMIKVLSKSLGCGRFVVTRGNKGCLIYSDAEGFVEVPAFAQKVVDRVGAGDAFLSVTSLAAYLKVPSEVLGLIGNMVGSLAVEILGNKKSIDKASLQKYLLSMLK